MKKYQTNDLSGLEPVLTLADMPEDDQDAHAEVGFGTLPAIRFVGGVEMTGNQPVSIPTTSTVNSNS